MNRAHTAQNEKVIFREKVEYALYKTCQSHIFDEKLITRGSMYGHFPHDGLARGRIRDRFFQKHMICSFRKKHKRIKTRIGS